MISYVCKILNPHLSNRRIHGDWARAVFRDRKTRKSARDCKEAQGRGDDLVSKTVSDVQSPGKKVAAYTCNPLDEKEERGGSLGIY